MWLPCTDNLLRNIFRARWHTFFLFSITNQRWGFAEWVAVGASPPPTPHREFAIRWKIPRGWRSSLLRAGNNNETSLSKLTAKLIPIQTADREDTAVKYNHDSRWSIDSYSKHWRQDGHDYNNNGSSNDARDNLPAHDPPRIKKLGKH